MDGLALIELATSLPELSSITTALRLRRCEITFGQVLGTNFINLSLILLADAVFRGWPVVNELSRFEFSFRIHRASDGAERWVTMSGWRTYRTDSQLRRIIITARDVTEEKTVEERVRWAASHC